MYVLGSCCHKWPLQNELHPAPHAQYPSLVKEIDERCNGELLCPRQGLPYAYIASHTKMDMAHTTKHVRRPRRNDTTTDGMVSAQP